MDAKQVAAKVGESMFAADAASREFLQMELVSCEPGRAAMTLPALSIRTLPRPAFSRRPL